MNELESHIFTYVVEFRGGTYCTQVKSENIENSVFKWLEKIKEEKKEIHYLGSKTLQELEFQILNQEVFPTKVEKLNNVWFLNFNCKSGSFLINIIKTSAI